MGLGALRRFCSQPQLPLHRKGRATAEERRSLLQFVEKESARAAEQLKRDGQPAPPELVRGKAMTQMCRVILNLNEFVYSD